MTHLAYAHVGEVCIHTDLHIRVQRARNMHDEQCNGTYGRPEHQEASAERHLLVSSSNVNSKIQQRKPTLPTLTDLHSLPTQTDATRKHNLFRRLQESVYIQKGYVWYLCAKNHSYTIRCVTEVGPSRLTFQSG